MSVPIDPESKLYGEHWYAELDLSGAYSSFDHAFDPIEDGTDLNKKARFAAKTIILIRAGLFKVKISKTNNTTKTRSYCHLIGPYKEEPTVDEGTRKMLEHLGKEVEAPSSALDLLEAYWRRLREWHADASLSDQQQRSSREDTPAPPGAPRMGCLDDNDVPEGEMGNFW
ncbi:hypothetical protein ABOM_010253 [Aspergillus bombycis]|uniref:Uncharacterized protein n=1 Tax=Aspergillus bombycis TaxID=109264 RepID=A0A1F7ZPM2_9EURO|nr:hypothetical protein ABOM_010253 [Aspergillus bombycis]OGM41410.1 hypothetical protein ABOM_010253 [Aspergillus bombycis]